MFYNQLNKPIFTPPPVVFSIVWPILYTLLFYLFVTNPSLPFALHLLLNFTWTPIFFGQQNVGGALAVVTLMLLTALWLVRSLPWIFVIYVGWIAFAFVLNVAIFFMN